MSIGLIIFLVFVVIFLLLLITVVGNIFEGLANTDDTPTYISNIGNTITEIITNPIDSFLYLLEVESPFIYIGLILIAIFVGYIFIKSFFKKRDNNLKNSDYKIAKHGSHGSARWSKKNEIFSDGTFVGLNEDKAYKQVLKNMKRGE